MQKRYLTTLLLSTLFIGGQVFAEENVTSPSVPEISTVSSVTEKHETINVKETRLDKINNRGLSLVRERINSLTREREGVTKSKLTDVQKKELTDMIDQQIANMTSLKIVLASSTDATSSKNYVESIAKDYRIYAVFIPKVKLITRIYTLQNHIGKVTGETFVKVQANIDAQKAKGKDVATWQAGLDKAKTTVATDTATLATLLTKVQGLKASDYGTTSKAVIQDTNYALKTISKDLRTINALIKSPRYMKDVSKEHTGTSTITH